MDVPKPQFKKNNYYFHFSLLNLKNVCTVKK